MSEKRYVILELSDAKALAEAARSSAGEGLAHVIGRLDAETGGDMEQIAAQLKRMSSCPACVIEGQEHSCSSIYTRKLGRRLFRLVERAQRPI